MKLKIGLELGLGNGFSMAVWVNIIEIVEKVSGYFLEIALEWNFKVVLQCCSGYETLTTRTNQYESCNKISIHWKHGSLTDLRF